MALRSALLLVSAHFFAYVLLQAITGVSEFIWFVCIVVAETYTVINIVILLIVILVQVSQWVTDIFVQHCLLARQSTKLERITCRRK